MKIYHFVCMLLLISFSSCSKDKNDFMFMNNLKNDISKTYEIEKIDIKMSNHNDIEISIIDSKFSNYSSEEKQKIAKQIGKLITELRENMPKIKTGKLIFTNKSNYLIVKTSHSESFNLF